MSHSSSELDRRSFLKNAGIVGTIGVTTLAGCTEASGSQLPQSLQFRVEYNYRWSGSLSNFQNSYSIGGWGFDIIDWNGEIPATISIMVQKMEMFGLLSVEIVADGMTVERGSTNADYGIVSLTHTF